MSDTPETDEFADGCINPDAWAEFAQKLERKADKAARLAAQLVAFISVNALAGKFRHASYDDVDKALTPFIERLREVQPTFDPTNETNPATGSKDHEQNH